MNNKPLVSVITVLFNNYETCHDLLLSMRKSSYQNLEMIVIDNGSEKDRGKDLRKLFPEIKLIRSEKNLGFAGGNNIGIKAAKGSYVFFINDDAIIQSDTIHELLYELISDPKVGIASPKIIYANTDKRIQYAGSTGMNFFTMRNKHIGNGEKDKGQYDIKEDTHFAHGAAMMLPMRVVKNVGPMRESYFLYYEELDWCTRIKKTGLKVRYVGTTFVYHKASVTTGINSPLKTYYLNRNRILFLRTFGTPQNKVLGALFIGLVSVPRNIFRFSTKSKHLKAYLAALVWNIKLKTNPLKF